MKNLFENTSSVWVRYSKYQLEKDAKGILYITPAPGSSPVLYDPLEDYQSMVVDALNLGRLASKEETSPILQEKILDFVHNYGLLGFMTALPTTADFMEYEQVYLPKNHFIREEVMGTQDYLSLFFPFDRPDLENHGTESSWSIPDDKPMMALSMALADRPMAVNLCCQRQYAERFDWIVQALKDWVFTFLTSFLFYLDRDRMDELSKELFIKGMSAFGGSAPTYHIELRERPTIVWEFHSLMRQIQMLYSFMLTDEDCTLTCCANCGKVFVSEQGEKYCCDICERDTELHC